MKRIKERSMPQTSNRGKYLGPPKKSPKKKGGQDIKDGKKRVARQQQKMATAVRAAALKSGMDWSDWVKERKKLVKAFRVKGETKASRQAVRKAVKLIKKSDSDPNIAANYARAAKKLDKKGPNRASRLATKGGPSATKPKTRSSGGKMKKKTTKKKGGY